MSYKFSLDHTLSLADIHDMIAVDIKPETRCTVVNGDMAINGYLSFRGSYLTPELAEAPFEGYIPVDISLPYRGGSLDVSPEIVGFDYQVDNRESLTLNLEIALAGYSMDEPRVEEITHEEAIIEPFDFVMSSDDPLAEEEIPDSLLALLDEREDVMVAPETILEEEEPVFEELVVADFLPVLEEEPVNNEPHMTESAAVLMDELFALRRETDLKPELGIVDVPVEPEEVLDDSVLERSNSSSLARQFGDSFTTFKMVNTYDETAE